MTVCACMGPQGNDPVCPCRMKAGCFRQEWCRFPEVENNLQFSDKPRNGPVYVRPIVLTLKPAGGKQ